MHYTSARGIARALAPVNAPTHARQTVLPGIFFCALNFFVHNSVVPADIDGAHAKVEFLNACIKCFGKKDVTNEIEK